MALVILFSNHNLWIRVHHNIQTLHHPLILLNSIQKVTTVILIKIWIVHKLVEIFFINNHPHYLTHPIKIILISTIKKIIINLNKIFILKTILTLSKLNIIIMRIKFRIKTYICLCIQTICNTKINNINHNFQIEEYMTKIQNKIIKVLLQKWTLQESIIEVLVL